MRKFCLIGKKLAHSYSALIHEKFGYPYDLVELKEEEVENFVRSGEYGGFNVTIPYKETVMPFLDALDGSAVFAGAVNTVVRREGKLTGFNTDLRGMEYMLKDAGIELYGKKVIIFGSGGTSKTAAALAKLHKASSATVISRSGADNYENLYKHHDADVIINATPVGMYPENGKRLISLDGFKNLSGVADVIYNPLITDLLFQAKERGIKNTNGLKMLIAQAKYARDLFLGEEADDRLIEKIYDGIYKDIINIILIGMPSSGKSLVGKLLSNLTKKPFKDTDIEIEVTLKQDIPSIFQKYGEEKFRETEAEITERLGKERGCVIATGGGLVMNPYAYQRLKQNSIIVHLERDIEKTKADGRPLLKDKNSVTELYNLRMPVYKAFADITVDNNGGAEECAALISERIDEYISNKRS